MENTVLLPTWLLMKKLVNGSAVEQKLKKITGFSSGPVTDPAPGANQHLYWVHDTRTSCELNPETLYYVMLQILLVWEAVTLTVDNELRVFVEFVEPQSFFQLQLRRHGAGVTWWRRRDQMSFSTLTCTQESRWRTAVRECFYILCTKIVSVKSIFTWIKFLLYDIQYCGTKAVRSILVRYNTAAWRPYFPFLCSSIWTVFSYCASKKMRLNFTNNAQTWKLAYLFQF